MRFVARRPVLQGGIQMHHARFRCVFSIPFIFLISLSLIFLPQSSFAEEDPAEAPPESTEHDTGQHDQITANSPAVFFADVANETGYDCDELEELARAYEKAADDNGKVADVAEEIASGEDTNALVATILRVFAAAKRKDQAIADAFWSKFDALHRLYC